MEMRNDEDYQNQFSSLSNFCYCSCSVSLNKKGGFLGVRKEG